MVLLVALLTGSTPGETETAFTYARVDLAGDRQDLQQYRGKVVVLNFWATWCVPCVQEMPMLAELQRKHSDRIVVIGVSLDDPEATLKVREFVTRRRIGFPIWLNGSPEDLEKFGLGVAVPATAFFDAQGRQVGRVLGQLNHKRLKRRVSWMLGEGTGAPPPELENNLED